MISPSPWPRRRWPASSTGSSPASSGTLCSPDQYQARFGQRYFRVLMEEVTGVTVVGLDRNQRIVALDPSEPTILDDLQAAGLANFDQDVILDPVHNDFFTRKLLAALQEIGNPPLARNSPFAARSQAATSTPPAPGQAARGESHRRTPRRPTSSGMRGRWRRAPSRGTCRPSEPHSSAHGLDLNPTQWQAWEDALDSPCTPRLGAAGDGKSRTVAAIVVGAVLEAHRRGPPAPGAGLGVHLHRDRQRAPGHLRRPGLAPPGGMPDLPGPVPVPTISDG